MKPRILVDIDVVAVAKHYINDKDYPIAKPFIDRAEEGEFELFSTRGIVEIVGKWKEKEVKYKTLKFYSDYCYSIPPAEIDKKIEEKGVDFEDILNQLEKKDVKREDGALAVIASLFGMVLVTLNRKHLRNKRDEINKILKENGLNEIKILLPNEI